MTIDNFDILSRYVPQLYDGDTFLYTELLDRSKRAGNNKGRRLRTYYHRSRSEFFEQREGIVAMCEHLGARAYFRPSARSFKSVGKAFAAHILDQAMTGNWEGMRHGYSSVCGKHPAQRVWLFDFDEPSATPLSRWLMDSSADSTKVPSRKGFHVLTPPFDRRIIKQFGENVQLHRDNPTNLYIPTEAV